MDFKVILKKFTHISQPQKFKKKFLNMGRILNISFCLLLLRKISLFNPKKMGTKERDRGFNIKF